MEKKKNGGSAFPFNRDVTYEQNYPEVEGMTLRDYFAAHALSTLDREVFGGGNYDENIASQAFTIADAMIIQRDK